MGVLLGADGAAGELAPCETDGAEGAALAAGSASDVALGAAELPAVAEAAGGEASVPTGVLGVGVLAEAEAGAGAGAGGCGLAEGAVRLV